jgi:hypothetical protein
MCSTPSIPSAPTTPKKEEIATPTQADAGVTKAGAAAKDKAKALAGRDVKTAPRGLTGVAAVQNKKLLGE